MDIYTETLEETSLKKEKKKKWRVTYSQFALQFKKPRMCKKSQAEKHQKIKSVRN